MAIKVTNIKVGGKTVRNLEQVEVAKKIKKTLKRSNIKADVVISRYYSDRWYAIKDIPGLIKEDKREKERDKKRRKETTDMLKRLEEKY